MDISSIISFKYTAVRLVSLIVTTGIISGLIGKAFAADNFSSAFHPQEHLNHSLLAYYPGHQTYATDTWDPEPEAKNFWPNRLYHRPYPEETATAHWYGADSPARAITMKTAAGQVSLKPTPVSGLTGLRDSLLYHSDQALEIKTGMTLLHEHQISVPVFEIEAEILPGMAKDVGFQIRSDEEGAMALIGYDAGTESIYIDSHHAKHDFVRFFPARHYARVKLNAGVLKLRIRVDMSSVTVFSGVGDVVLTDQIFPQLSDTGMKIFSHGGVSVLKKISIWSMHSVWEHSHLIF